MPPPSIRSLARQLGLSAATVSLALRESPRVVEATRRRVKQAAARAGYRPNPLVGSVLTAVRRAGHAGFQGALMAINHTEAEKPVLPLYHREIFAGAKRRAAELGYSLELSWVGPRQLPLARLGAILRARNAQGVVVLPFATARDFSGLEWGSLSAVMMDFCLTAPVLHAVLPDHHVSILRALERLAARGYRRPGLALAGDRDERLLYRWSAGFGSFARAQGVEAPVPVLWRRTMAREDFVAWFRAHRPDVVLGHLQAEFARWLREEGAPVPRDTGFLQLNWTERTAPCAGLDQQPALLGAAAVESVVAQLQRNEQGVPAHPKMIMLGARWVDGPTLRAAR
jgi:LacI family transcriptional regulator